MKSTSRGALAVICLATLVAAGCAGDLATSPEQNPAAAAAAGGNTFRSAGGEAKVTICHIPPGNPENAHTITIGAPAVAAHLAHGCTLDACYVEPPPE